MFGCAKNIIEKLINNLSFESSPDNMISYTIEQQQQHRILEQSINNSDMIGWHYACVAPRKIKSQSLRNQYIAACLYYNKPSISNRNRFLRAKGYKYPNDVTDAMCEYLLKVQLKII